MISDLFVNIAILTTFLFLVGQFFGKYTIDKKNTLPMRIIVGLCSGILGVVLMLYSIDVTSTIIVDLRNTAIICAAVAGGPVSAMLASVIIAFYRVLNFGINNASITGFFIAIIMGIGCSIISCIKVSRLKQFMFMLLYVLGISSIGFVYLLRNYNRVLSVFAYYIPISVLGVIIAYFTMEYIISKQVNENEIKKTNEKIWNILESIQDAFFTIDSSWKFTYVNNKFIGMLLDRKKNISDILNKYIWEVLPKQKYLYFFSEFEKSMSEKKPVSFEGYSEISKCWYSVNVYPNRTGISVYFRDITENKLIQNVLRESDERFRAAFEYAAVGMALKTIEGRFISANQPYCSMLGYSEEELKEMNFLSLTHPDDREENQKAIDKLLSGEVPSFHIEKRYIHKDGHVIWVQLNTSLIHDSEGNPKYFIAQAQNITKRILAAEELKRINKELIEQRAEAECQREEAIKANKYKSQFLAAMSHELRTPLNSIIGFTNRVLKKCGDILPHTQRENLEIVRDEAEHLLELINDLLDYSKIEAGKMEVYTEEFDLKEVIEQAVVITKNIAESKNLCFKQRLPDTKELLICSDKMKVKQILTNLLSNAFKYSERGQVGLYVSSQDKFYQIIVEDEGVGISHADLERIFDEFHQIDGSYTRRVGGTGLGLSITRRFVDMLKGRIEVKSTLGEGSKFTVLLPKHYEEKVYL